MSPFLLRFVLILVGLFALLEVPQVHLGVVEPFTAGVAHISALIMGALDERVYAQGALIGNRLNGFAVLIRPGCNGVEAMAMLTAAMLAFPASARWRMLGLGLGMLAIQAANLLRIISLFYLGQWSEPVFEFAHVYLWPTLIILDAVVVFLIWLHYQPRAPAHA